MEKQVNSTQTKTSPLTLFRKLKIRIIYKGFPKIFLLKRPERNW
jgi:hypothetical protein